MTAEHDVFLQQLNLGFAQAVPHNAAIGLRVIDADDQSIVAEVPYRADLVGNPETGVLHGGVLTTLMDATCGASVFLRIRKPVPAATLDLRIDYLRPATPLRDVRCRAECYRVTRNVAFVRGHAYHEGAEGDPIAVATGTFAIFARGGRGLAAGRREP